MPGGRVVDFFTTQPVRVSALLRLPLIGLIVILVSVWDVDHWLPGLYAVILSAYAAAAVLWLVVVFRGPMPPWAEWASTAVDVLVLVALCAVSGGATAALKPRNPTAPARSPHGECVGAVGVQRIRAMIWISTSAPGSASSVTPTAVQAGYGAGTNSSLTSLNTCTCRCRPTW